MQRWNSGALQMDHMICVTGYYVGRGARAITAPPMGRRLIVSLHPRGSGGGVPNSNPVVELNFFGLCVRWGMGLPPPPHVVSS